MGNGVDPNTLRQCLDITHRANSDRYAASRMIRHHWHEGTSFIAQLWGPQGSGKNIQLAVWRQDIMTFADPERLNPQELQKFLTARKTYFIDFHNARQPKNVGSRAYTKSFYTTFVQALESEFPHRKVPFLQEYRRRGSSRTKKMSLDHVSFSVRSPQPPDRSDLIPRPEGPTSQGRLRYRSTERDGARNNPGQCEAFIPQDTSSSLSTCETTSSTSSLLPKYGMASSGPVRESLRQASSSRGMTSSSEDQRSPPTRKIPTRMLVHRIVRSLDFMAQKGHRTVIFLRRIDLCSGASQKILYGILTHMADEASSVILLTTALSPTLVLEKRISSRYTPFYVSMVPASKDEEGTQNLMNVLKFLVPCLRTPSTSALLLDWENPLLDTLRLVLDCGLGLPLLLHCVKLYEKCFLPSLKSDELTFPNPSSVKVRKRKDHPPQGKKKEGVYPFVVAQFFIDSFNAVMDPGRRVFLDVPVSPHGFKLGGNTSNLLAKLNTWIHRLRCALCDCLVLTAAVVLTREQTKAYYQKLRPKSKKKEAFSTRLKENTSGKESHQSPPHYSPLPHAFFYPSISSPPPPATALSFIASSLLRLLGARDGGLFPMCAPSMLQVLDPSGCVESDNSRLLEEKHPLDAFEHSLFFEPTWYETVLRRWKDSKTGAQNQGKASLSGTELEIFLHLDIDEKMWYASISRLLFDRGLLVQLTPVLLVLTLPPVQCLVLIRSKLELLVNFSTRTRQTCYIDVGSREHTRTGRPHSDFFFINQTLDQVYRELKATQRCFLAYSESVFRQS